MKLHRCMTMVVRQVVSSGPWREVMPKICPSPFGSGQRGTIDDRYTGLRTEARSGILWRCATAPTTASAISILESQATESRSDAAGYSTVEEDEILNIYYEVGGPGVLCIGQCPSVA
jgi:hypothetical protein